MCFPSCERDTIFDKYDSDHLSFEVKAGLEHKSAGCGRLAIGIESLVTACSFNVPYWHSNYYPCFSGLEPWKLNVERTRLLCFVGGVTRGNSRGRVLTEMRAVAVGCVPVESEGEVAVGEGAGDFDHQLVGRLDGTEVDIASAQHPGEEVVGRVPDDYMDRIVAELVVPAEHSEWAIDFA